jgi:hypothetical protein
MGETRNAHKILVGKSRKETFGGPRHRWESTIKHGLREVGCEDVDRIELAQNVSDILL